MWSEDVLVYKVFISMHSNVRAQARHTDAVLCSCDLDLMTSIYKLDLDIPKQVSRSRLSEVKSLNETDRRS